MRILIASGTWHPHQNGVARVATAVARALVERGHMVTALVPQVAGQPDEEREGSLTVRRTIARGWLPLTIGDVLQTRKSARGREEFDVLVAHGVVPAVGLARARLGRPLVLVYHASLSRELRFMRPRLPLGRERLVGYLNEPIARLVEREAVKKSANILALSEYSRSLLAADHPEEKAKVRPVSGGVDLDSFNPGDGTRSARERLGVDPGRVLLVTVRRAEPRMGIEELLRAVALLGRDDVTLAVVGGGLLTDQLRRLSEELGLGSRVLFSGHVPESQLRDWYRAADLFVLPSVAYEGFGMVTLEALASGTPVVGTPVGATPELLEPLEPGLVAACAEASALAEAIERTLSFADDGLGRRCREYAVARFGWDAVVVQWERALLEAVRERG